MLDYYSNELRLHNHLEKAGSSHLFTLSRWEETDPEFGRRLGADFYGRPDGLLEQLCHEEHRSGWLALLGHVPMGLMDLNVDSHEGLGYLSLYVAPDFRDQGVGAELAVRAAASARATGLCGLLAEVEADNLACARCVEKAGFSELPGGSRLFGLDLRTS